MRKLFILSILLLSIVAHAQVKKINTETDVQHVTIFSSGAQVQRTASVAIAPGRSEITFTGFSNQLTQQSVQLKADAAITLLSVQTTKDFLSNRKLDVEEKNGNDRITSLKDKIDADVKLLEVYKNEEAMLIKNQSIGGTAGVKAADLKAALDLQRQRLTEVYNLQLEVAKRIAAEQKEATILKAQSVQTSKKRDSINYTVTAVVESKENRNVKFEIQYTVKDAGWYPAYDIRLADVTQPLELMMNANVYQRSGETWKDVALALSTGNPTDNATPSTLQPWKLGYYDPSIGWMQTPALQQNTTAGRITNENGEPVSFATITVKGTNNATQSDANGFFKLEHVAANSTAVISSVGYEQKEVMLKPGYLTIQLKQNSQNLQEVVVVGYGLQGRAAGVAVEDNYVKRKKDELQPVSVVTQYQPTTTVYKIDEKYTLETDGKTTTIGIKKFSLPAQYEYYTAPKTDASVYLTARVVNWQDYDLQSGEASLYFEGSYLGKTYIDIAVITDTLSLSLGKDNNIKVARKLVKEFSTKKLIGSNKTETKQYEITLSNNKKIPVNIVVQDQFPVSVVKEIDVNDVAAPGAETDKEQGIVTWRLVLPPAQEKKLRLGYSIKYPKDKKVILE